MAYPVRAFEDAVEPRSQFGCAFRAGGELERLELTIEPPDHPPRDFDSAALPVVGGDELVDETLGVNPTQRVVADAELPRVIGEDDGAGEPILGAERAPQRAFAGHAHGIRGDPQLGQAERAHMRPPVGFTGEFEDFCASQRIDDAVRQIGRAHIGHRRCVDRIARRPPKRLRKNMRRDLLGPVRNAVNRSEPNCVV